ncbi:PAS domain-containing sensor histidine kinase [Candidatus Pyrohabitans sp.]
MEMTMQRHISGSGMIEPRLEGKAQLKIEAGAEIPEGIVAENINLGMVVVLDGAIEFANSKFCEISGFEKEELIGTPFVKLVSSNSRELLMHENAIYGIAECEIEILSKEGEGIPVEVNTSLIEFNGRPAEMMILRDVTEQKKLEEELFIRQEKLIAMTYELEQSNYLKDLFLDIMRHDLLNPIGVANNFVELLLDDEKDPEKVELLNAIRRGLSKAVKLVNDATKLSKLGSIESLELEDLDIKEVLEEVVEDFIPLASKAGMHIENKITHSLYVRANKIIGEVFANFISNAIKYAPEGKMIVIEGEEAYEFVRIKVMDFGSGIKDEDKLRIFDRFTRREKGGVKGSGLGLTIAKKIVEFHKGKVWVEDNPQGGAVFVVELPKQGSNAGNAT